MGKKSAQGDDRMIEQLLFDVSNALLVPVLILTVAALALVIVEAGALLVEVRRRRRRSLWGLERAVEECRGRLAAGMPAEALAALLPFAWNQRMEDVLSGIVEQCGRPGSDARLAKRLAEYDYLSLRRLERTRILVRRGPPWATASTPRTTPTSSTSPRPFSTPNPGQARPRRTRQRPSKHSGDHECEGAKAEHAGGT
jgi:hypothetical protein